MAFNPKPHARIIWDVAFSPMFGGEGEGKGDMVFATASRDKTVKIWRRPDTGESARWEVAKTIKCEEGVTSCDFYPAVRDGK